MEAAVEAAVEVAILVAVALPFVRLATCRPFIRRLGGAPEQAILGVGALIAYAAIVAATVIVAPLLLRPMAAAAVTLTGLAWWRSRPNFGRDRGMPPGSLRVAPIGPWTGPDYFKRDAERFGPVFKSTTFFSPVVCVVGLPTALELFAEHDKSLAPPVSRFARFIPRGFIRSMSVLDHDSYAPMLRSAVSGAVTRALDHAVDTGTPGHTTGPNDLARAAVFPSFYRLFFGIQPGDPRVARLNTLYDILEPLDAWRQPPRRIQRAINEIVELFKRDQAVDDGADEDAHADDTFVAAARRAHPDSADDPTLTKNLVYLLQTSASDVSALMTWLLWMLGQHPAVLTGPADEGSGIARRFVSETLRLAQSEYIMRRASETFTWRGFTIARGTRVRICIRESHRDPSVFDRADDFEPDRWLNAARVHEQFSPFGAVTSRSRCLGEGLTLTFGRLFVEEVIAGYDMRVVNDGPIEFSGVHWRPSTKFQITLSARHPVAVAMLTPAIPERVGGLIPSGH